MEVQISKWGNSLGIRIPSKLAGSLDMRAGSEADVAVVAGRLVITPKKTSRIPLKVLLASAQGKQESEISTGPERGREVIEW